MLWFRMFFSACADGHFELCDKQVRNHTPNQQVEYHRREFTAEQEAEIEGSDANRIPLGVSSSGN